MKKKKIVLLFNLLLSVVAELSSWRSNGMLKPCNRKRSDRMSHRKMELHRIFLRRVTKK